MLVLDWQYTAENLDTKGIHEVSNP